MLGVEKGKEKKTQYRSNAKDSLFNILKTLFVHSFEVIPKWCDASKGLKDIDMGDI